MVTWTFFVGMALVWVDTFQEKKGPGWLFLIGMLTIIAGWIISGARAERGGFRFETRYTFLTLYKGDDIFAHEDMRLLKSLMPQNAKIGSITSYCATFDNDNTITIFSDLENFGALISKLSGFLDKSATDSAGNTIG